MMELDIVIVNWNTGFQLRECLQSITQTTSADDLCKFKWIVVDNDSQDGSADKLEENYPSLTLVRNQENKGFAFACNQGAKKGKSEYILFLNPDIKLVPGSLTKALHFMEEEQHNHVGILGIQLVGEDGQIQRNAARFPTPGSLFYQMLGLDRIWPDRFPPHFLKEWDHRENRTVDQVTGAFYLVRRKLFQMFKGFDECFFMYFEDLDFAYQAKQAGWISYYLADVQGYHFGGGSSYQVKARRLSYILESRVLYAAKHFGPSSALGILVASLLLEFWVRLVGSMASFSRHNIIETIQAYQIFLGKIPQLLRDVGDK